MISSFVSYDYYPIISVLYHTFWVFLLNQSLTFMMFMCITSEKRKGTYIKLSSYILKSIASFNAVFLFPFVNLNFSYIFIPSHDIGYIGNYIIHTQLSYYIIDTIYSLVLNNKQAIIHHCIGLGMIQLPVFHTLYRNAYSIANFGTQGSTLFVRIFDIQRLYLDKYNNFERYLVYINIRFYFLLGFFVMYPMTFYVIYLFRYEFYNAFFIFQLLYNFYWDKKLIHSYISYTQKTHKM